MAKIKWPGEELMTPVKKTAARKPSPSTSLNSPESTEVPAGVFKNTCLSLMDDVRDTGSRVLITKHGTPVAMLVPPEASSTASAFGYLRGTVLDAGDIVSPDFEAWGDD